MTVFVNVVFSTFAPSMYDKIQFEIYPIISVYYERCLYIPSLTPTPTTKYDIDSQYSECIWWSDLAQDHWNTGVRKIQSTPRMNTEVWPEERIAIWMFCINFCLYYMQSYGSIPSYNRITLKIWKTLVCIFQVLPFA